MTSGLVSRAEEALEQKRGFGIGWIIFLPETEFFFSPNRLLFHTERRLPREN
jgi:hypothetical protein